MKTINTVICGGDRRMLSTASLFSKLGRCCLWRCASGDVMGADRINTLREAPKDPCVILPIPSFDKNALLNGGGHVNAEELFRQLPSNSRIYGAKAAPIISRLATEHGHTFFDYGEREDFNLLNAVPTAEAAILIAMEHSTKTIQNQTFAVIGYGRIGKILARRLSDLGGRVYVCARSNSALAAAECDGHIPVALSEALRDCFSCDICFNTVPVQIFDEVSICKWKSSYFIELASLPGGFTEAAKKRLSEKYITALSLPGRYFPTTAGEIIYKTVLSMITNGGAK
ncbi:MAG: NAD(P)-binding domain-containing protein [Ruminococcus sp.]|nr:NAD(P)-binding domain-containing protein [Ruminococcus sp.]